MRRIVFLDPDTGRQVTMPVTPPAWMVSEGREIETLDMAQAQELHLLGSKKLMEGQAEYLLPRHPTSWTAPGYDGDGQKIVDQLRAWSTGGIVVRYIITGTTYNVPVLLGPVDWGEQGAGPDLVVKLSLYEYRNPGVSQSQIPGTGNGGRPNPPKPAGQGTTYTVRKGDSLWEICRRQYGDGRLFKAVARVNGIKNPNLIFPEQKIRLPPRSQL